MQKKSLSLAQRLGLSLSAACALLPVHAQTAANTNTAVDSTLGETVVTATRSPAKVEATLAEVQVITHEQLQAAAPGRGLAEVLQRLAGVQLSANGGRGQAQSVFIRGASGEQTLLLVDGVRYGSAVYGGLNLQNLPLELIERIEVVKGPMSALYGSDAVAGVIQIFTRRGQGGDKALSAQASATVGEYGHKAASLSLGGAQAGWDYQLSLSRVQERGSSATRAAAGPYTYHPDRDGFDQSAVQLAVGYAINSDWRLEGNWMQSQGKSYMDDGPGDNNPFTDLQSRVGRLALKGVVMPNWSTSFALGHSIDQTQYLQAAWSDNHLRTEQTSYHWDNHIDTPLGMVLAGLERLEQKVDTTTPYSVRQRHINAGFVGLTGNAGRHHWQGNLRRDDNSQFGGFTTYGISYGLDVGAGLRLLAAHGKSLRVPTFDQLYGQWGAPYDGNPLLQPERGKNYEAGVQWNYANHSAKLLRFDNRVDQLIAAGSTQMENLPGRTRLKGWSLSYGFAHDGWQVSAALEQLNTRTADGSPLLRRAKQQWSVNVDKELGAWRVGTSVLRVGSRPDTDFATYQPVRLGAYTTVDARLAYRINPSLSAQLRVANLGNKQYETAFGYPQLGRAAYLTLQWQMR